MAALTSAPFVLLFTFSGIFAQSQDTKEIRVKPGEDVTLNCQGPQGAAIEAFKWRRPDLKSDGYVFLYRDGSPVEKYQLECYRGRVKLNPEMKNGDASVILTNATVKDTGTYECFVPESNGGRRRRAADIRQIINLKVTEPDRVHGGLVAAFIVAGACCAGLVAWVKRRSLKKKSESPAADGANVQISLNP